MSSRGVAVRLLVVALLLSTWAPLVFAQAANGNPPPSKVEVEDKASDVMLNAGQRAGVPPQSASQIPFNTDHLDILGVFFGKETEKTFEVHLRLKALHATQTPFPVGFAFRAVTFSYGEIHWQIRVGPCQGGWDNSDQQVAGCLGFRDGASDQYRSHLTIEATEDSGSTAFVFIVPKDAIFNQDRVPGRYGADLDNIAAYTFQWFFGIPWFPGQDEDPTGGVQAVDYAPDDGVVDEIFTFVRGSGSRGHLSMTSNEPIRVSNGEATTIVFKVDLFNDADTEVTAEMKVEGARSDWTVRVPALVNIEPQSSLTFPVIVALPFTHDHGKTATFTVKAQDLADANSYAAVDLGVFWTDIPQPSAHHNGELWFHSAPAQSNNPIGQVIPQTGMFFRGWMNSIEDDPDPAAVDANVGGFPSGGSGIGCFFGQAGPTACVPPENRVSWFFPLSPKLLIGLDFEVLREGKLIADILPKVSATNAQLSAEVLYCDPTNQTRGGNGQGGGGGDDNRGGNGQCNQYNVLLASGFMTRAVSANSPANFEIPLGIESRADLLPYKSGANIAIRLTLLTDTPQTVMGMEPRPEFVTKSARLYLPLIEYHDPVAAEFQNVGSLKLEPLSGFEKQVNPGETVLFSFNLTNNAKQPQKMVVQLEGINREWARLAGSAEFELAAGGTRTLTVAVAPPVDAQEAESAELFLVAESAEDQSIVTVTRIRATVVTGTDVEDEGAALNLEKTDTPMVGFVPVLAVLAVAVWMRRRR